VAEEEHGMCWAGEHRDYHPRIGTLTFWRSAQAWASG
jgi:hypothetical protein